jgi:hypothetical protein
MVTTSILPGFMSLDLSSTIVLSERFGLTEKIQYTLAQDETPLVLSVVAAPMFMRRCGVDTFVAKSG